MSFSVFLLDLYRLVPLIYNIASHLSQQMNYTSILLYYSWLFPSTDWCWLFFNCKHFQNKLFIFYNNLLSVLPEKDTSSTSSSKQLSVFFIKTVNYTFDDKVARQTSQRKPLCNLNVHTFILLLTNVLLLSVTLKCWLFCWQEKVYHFSSTLCLSFNY